jgi:hypothetical protein
MLDKETEAKVLDELHADLMKMNGDEPTWRQAFAILIMLFAVILPALQWAGFGPDSFLRRIPFEALIVISCIAGMIAGALFHPKGKYWYVGLLPGMCAGMGSFALTYLCTKDRAKIGVAEMFIWPILGSLPAFIFYYFAIRWVVLREARTQEKVLQTQTPKESDSKPSSQQPD